MAELTLPEASWRSRAGLGALIAALEGEARYVGGAVRDTLLGGDVGDVDIATPLTPETVMQRLRDAGIKAIPTGIAHGTVTGVLEGGHVEITTLRRDVSTDGRRATVAFSDDWREDAARRDFTINALYADPLTGEIFDYFGGLADLQARCVRFIGEPLQRIAEDHLRILRFFRFHARYGQGEPNAAALAACTARARDLMALSRERIADELLKILALPDPSATIALMLQSNIFASVVPEIDLAGWRRLEDLIAAERTIDTAPDPIRRLTALLPHASADTVAARLKLSNAQRKRMSAAIAAGPETAEEALYRLGEQGALDRLLLSGRTGDWTLIRDRDRPVLPIGGGALVERGLSAGPKVAQALQAIERRWIDEGFPDAARVNEMADAEVAQLLRETR